MQTAQACHSHCHCIIAVPLPCHRLPLPPFHRLSPPFHRGAAVCAGQHTVRVHHPARRAHRRVSLAVLLLLVLHLVLLLVLLLLLLLLLNLLVLLLLVLLLVLLLLVTAWKGSLASLCLQQCLSPHRTLPFLAVPQAGLAAAEPAGPLQSGRFRQLGQGRNAHTPELWPGAAALKRFLSTLPA